MFYRPHFCCHCGEKIIRSKWTPLTSRRFCEFCEIEQKQHDLIPRAVMCIAILIGGAGLTAYLADSSGQGSGRPLQQSSTKATPRVNANNADSIALKANSSATATNHASANIKQRDAEKNSSTEPVYYCGAPTKKGTPCTRRVRTEGRCWQHRGMG